MNSYANESIMKQGKYSTFTLMYMYNFTYD